MHACTWVLLVVMTFFSNLLQTFNLGTRIHNRKDEELVDVSINFQN